MLDLGNNSNTIIVMITLTKVQIPNSLQFPRRMLVISAVSGVDNKSRHSFMQALNRI